MSTPARPFVRIIILVVISASFALWAQQGPTKPVALGEEPHHHLLLENPAARVYRLLLQPLEASQPHRHEKPYVFVSIGDSSLSIEVRGRQPVATNMKDGELRTSKGSFTIAERNEGQQPLTMVIVEILKADDGKTFEDPMASFKFHDTAVGSLFENTTARGDEMDMASGGRTEKHIDRYNRLLIALTDVQLDDDITGEGHREIRQKAGDIGWFPPTGTHFLSNAGTQPAHFIILEFR